MATMHNDTLTRPYLMAVGAVVLGALLTVAVTVWTRQPAPPALEVPVAGLTVRFVEQADGGLSVLNLATGGELDHLAEGENGFLRTMLRVIRRDIERTPDIISMPFRIEAWQDHRVTLTDSATGRSVDLLAFGPTNAEIFIRWLGGRNTRG